MSEGVEEVVSEELEEVVSELRAGGFRCDLLIFDTCDNAKVLDELKRQFPKFLKRIVSVLLSDSDSADGETEEHEAEMTAHVSASTVCPRPAVRTPRSTDPTRSTVMKPQ